MQTILAKSNPPQSLFDHLSQVRACALQTLSPARLAAFERLGVSSQYAQELCAGAAWLHDWGKATTQWQADIYAGKPKLPQHALSSFLACRWALHQKHDAMPPELLAMSLAVLAHHGQMHRDSFRANNSQVSPLLEVWRVLADELPFGGAPKDFKTPFDANKICTFVSESKARVSTLARGGNFRGLYCLLLNTLVQADHAASGGFDIQQSRLTGPQLARDWTPFQREVENHAADVLCAMAGCGAGKTAAALLRAARLADAHRVERIVLCLPTRFTSNSLLGDMSNADKYAYPQNMVGLVHSEALMVLRQWKEESEESEFPPENAASPTEIAARAARYEFPITVSTVDHLLMSLYHGYKFADRAFGNLMSSLVVFDEIHAYDATTLSAIRDGVRVLAAHGVPVVFMSATLPASRRRFLGAQPATTVIENANVFRPFTTCALPEPLTSGRGAQTQISPSAQKLLEESAALKLAVYVNQIERAKTLARAARELWPEADVYCYHSELAPRDRVKLEKEIIAAFREDRPLCLVATQAAELSLDISAERMISELASADIVVQRAGRLNRRGKTPEVTDATARLPQGFAYELFISPLWMGDADEKERAGCALPYVDLKHPAAGLKILELTWQNAPWNEVFSFERGLQWCEIALPDEPLYGDGGLREAAANDAVFGNKPQENFDGKNRDGVTIRDIDDATRPIMPQCLWGTIADPDKIHTLQDIAQLQIPMRYRKFHALSKMIFDTKVQIAIPKGKAGSQIIEYVVFVLKNTIPYDAQRGGFDFSKLAEENVAHGEGGALI